VFQFSNFNEGSTGMYADSITIVIERQYLIQEVSASISPLLNLPKQPNNFLSSRKLNCLILIIDFITFVLNLFTCRTKGDRQLSPNFFQVDKQ
jgi:hypothetical protein